MTKKLEELLNLPESQDIVKEEEQTEKKVSKKQKKDNNTALRDISEFDKIAAALPKVDGLGEMGDQELDDIGQRAVTAYEDLMDLGMNVESRYSGRIFEVAASMMRNAVDAKAAKMEKKLKMVELQLKKRKLDQESGGEEPIEAEGSIIFDRNELLKRIANSDK